VGDTLSSTVLVSPLAPEDCAARLGEAVDHTWLERLFGSKPVRGRLSARSFRLLKRIHYRNSFQTCLTGTLEFHVEGTILRVRSGMHPLVIAFLVVWFTGAGLGCAIILLGWLQGLVPGPVHAVGTIVPLLLLAFGIGLVRFCRWLARDEERFLIDFVAAVLGARVETDDGSGGVLR
jgi:hypothetical protein